ncbi:MAG: hypothetical protein WKF50_10310, partial [Nocardioides sp.]
MRERLTRTVRRGLARAAVCSLPLALLTAAPTSARVVTAPAAGAADSAETWFDRISTYPVFQNV